MYFELMNTAVSLFTDMREKFRKISAAEPRTNPGEGIPSPDLSPKFVLTPRATLL